MSYIISRLCSECKDLGCYKVCPEKCIYAIIENNTLFKNQFFIDPYECINCGLCENACPINAIYEEDNVPLLLKDDVKLNYSISNKEKIKAYLIK